MKKIYTPTRARAHARALALALALALPIFPATAQVSLVKDINPGTAYSSPDQLTEMGGKVYFFANAGSGNVLMETDGTPAGTQTVSTLDPSGNNPRMLRVIGNKLVFQYYTSAGNEPWVSDGTSAGTMLLKDIRSGSNSGGFTPLGVAGSWLYFQANSPGNSLWKTDGTTAGTMQVDNSAFSRAFEFKGKLYCWSTGPTPARGMYVLDGASSTPQLVKTMYMASSYDFAIAAGTDKFYFPNSDSVHGIEPWVSDGTAAGTMMVKDVNPGVNSSLDGGGSSSYTYMAVIGNTLYFTPTESTSGRELWVSDGTDAGTTMVKDIFAGGSSSNPGNLTAVNGKIVFNASSGPPSGFWISDGTAAGTQEIMDGSLSMELYGIDLYKGQVLIGGRYRTQEQVGVEMFSFDPSTTNAPVLVQDINSQAYSEGYSPEKYNHLATATAFYFIGTDASNGRELWKYVSSSTGMNELNKEISLDVYPNPATSVLHVKGNFNRIDLLDVTGKKVITDAGNEIDLTTLPSGIYILQALSADAIVNKKLIKQ